MAGAGDNDPLILVDEHDVAVGTAPKIEVHRRGLRHRAVSALVCNDAGQLLLQRRNRSKYHSGGLWTNACCSHPRPQEVALDAAHRRLQEEMGVACRLEPLFVTHYRADVSNGYVEDEIVHVFGGVYDGPVTPDPDEVSEWKWVDLADLSADLRARPETYTVWFRHYLRHFRQIINEWLDRSRRRPAS